MDKKVDKLLDTLEGHQEHKRIKDKILETNRKVLEEQEKQMADHQKKIEELKDKLKI